MKRVGIRLLVGLVLFLAGGGFLAYGGDWSSAVGFTVGLAGLVLMVWGWMGRQEGQEE